MLAKNSKHVSASPLRSDMRCLLISADKACCAITYRDELLRRVRLDDDGQAAESRLTELDELAPYRHALVAARRLEMAAPARAKAPP